MGIGISQVVWRKFSSYAGEINPAGEVNLVGEENSVGDFAVLEK